MDKRNRYWRRFQARRVFKARIKYCAYACWYPIKREDGTWDNHPHWTELAKDPGMKIFKTTGTPCSCWKCRNYLYDRSEFKKGTRRIIRESED